MEELLNPGLLVAFMFIMILSFGIANILTGLAEVADRRVKLAIHWLPFGWLVLLLMIHFGMFWDTLDLLIVEDWDFIGFVYVNLGPILVYVATGTILPREAGEDTADPREHYFRVAPLFFSLLCLGMLWGVGVDFILQDGFETESLWSMVGIPILVLLALNHKASVHAVGTLLYGVVMLSFFMPLGLGGLS